MRIGQITEFHFQRTCRTEPQFLGIYSMGQGRASVYSYMGTMRVFLHVSYNSVDKYFSLTWREWSKTKVSDIVKAVAQYFPL